MATVEEQFQAHTAREKLRAAAASVGEYVGKQDFTTFDPTHANRLRRTARVLDFMVGIVEAADPILTGTSQLDALGSHLDQMAPHLPGILSGSLEPIKPAHNLAEAIIAQQSRFVPKEHGAANEAFGAVSARLESQQKTILETASARVVELDQQAAAALAEARNAVAQIVLESGNLQKMLETLQQTTTQQSARLDTALNAFNSNSATLEQQRESRYQEWLVKQTETFAGKSEEEIAKVTTLLRNTENAANAAISSLEQTKGEAAKILNVIGNIGATGNYKLAADANEKSANSLRNGAVLLFLVMVGVVVSIAFNALHDGFKWEVAVFRLVSVLILSLPAAYLARESARHRGVAERMRRMELELASLDAFNALLPEADRNAIKAEMARRYFGNGGSKAANDEAKSEQPMTLKEFIKELPSILKAFRG